ncbi:hypothetical protein C9374_007198 [Naegleria lovaniensis]|uniref:EGF-like domain-containing protein n=1 Tax=Naegleria lovaniensis TaxID=51637 RepID=A0AA88KRZ5_NAELO|nr:uncharacterized protein C9374_007198 [Naegleria lovaniensis]KAG2393667.1 hypothetical protein C9374_007198 [Naegleria lovaniensis]
MSCGVGSCHNHLHFLLFPIHARVLGHSYLSFSQKGFSCGKFSSKWNSCYKLSIERGGGLLAVSSSSPVAGGIYFAEQNRRIVRRVLPDNSIQTIAGNGKGFTLGLDSGDPGPALSLPLGRVLSLAFDAMTEDIYFAEDDTYVIRKISTKGPNNGTISVVAGMIGLSGYNQDSGFANETMLNQISSMTVMGNGDLIFSDNACLIRRLSKTTDRITKLYGSLGCPTPISKMVVEPSGNFAYFTSTDMNRIYEVNLQNEASRVLAGNGTMGFSGNGTRGLNAALGAPYGISYYNGEIYFSESNNHMIRKIHPIQGVLIDVAGIPFVPGFSGDGKPALGALLNTPRDVFVNPNDGTIYINDYQNERIRAISQPDGTIRTVAGSGAAGPNPVEASLASLNYPSAITFNAQGDMFIADTQNQRIRMLKGNTVYTMAGTGARGRTDGQAIEMATFNNPQHLQFDESGTLLFIGDWGNFQVRKLDLQLSSVSTVVGTGEEIPILDNVNALLSGLASPSSMVYIPPESSVNLNPGLYIGSTSSGIRRVDLVSNIISTPVLPLLPYTSVLEMCFSADRGTDGSQNALPGLYYSMNNPSLSVYRILNQTVQILMAGNVQNVPASVDSNGSDLETTSRTTIHSKRSIVLDGDGSLATEAFLSPTSIYMTRKGELYLLDQDRIRYVTKEGIIGTLTFYEENKSTVSYTFQNPKSLHVNEKTGEIYIVERDIDLISKLVPITCFGKLASDPTVCFGYGTCVDTDTCQCYASSDPECKTTCGNATQPCYGNGVCTPGLKCVCFPGYSGPYCDSFTCKGLRNNDTAVCNYRNGTCIGPDQCSCHSSQWLGNDCSISLCEGLFGTNNALMCSSGAGSNSTIVSQESFSTWDLFNSTRFYNFSQAVGVTFPSTLYSYFISQVGNLTSGNSALLLSSIQDTTGSVIPVTNKGVEVGRILGNILSLNFLFKNGSKIQVKNLATPIELKFSNLTIPSRDVSEFLFSCMYLDTVTADWKEDGITSTPLILRNSSGFIEFEMKCLTTHLTSFAVIDKNFKSATKPQPSQRQVPVSSSNPKGAGGLSESAIAALVAGLVGGFLVLGVATCLVVTLVVLVVRTKAKKKQQL